MTECIYCGKHVPYNWCKEMCLECERKEEKQ